MEQDDLVMLLEGMISRLDEMIIEMNSEGTDRFCQVYEYASLMRDELDGLLESVR